MISVKSGSLSSEYTRANLRPQWSPELVPSSARSSSSVASPLPTQLVPLLSETLDKVKGVVDKAIPVGKKRTALEEAEWEDEGEDDGLEHELMLQCKLLRRTALYGSQ